MGLGQQILLRKCTVLPFWTLTRVICQTIYITIQYNKEFALKNWQTNQFNLAHKLKRTEMFLKKNEMSDTENRNTVECKTLKIRKMNNDWNKDN